MLGAVMYSSEADRWRAIQRRDQAAASSFVYAVVSTKIYCRPGCPSRLARRANVCFYDAPAQAAAAGYRPCLRCKPDQATFNVNNQAAQRDAVRKACEYIEESSGQAKFADVAKHVGLSTRYLYGLFKTVMGTTPAKYAAGTKPHHASQDSAESPSMFSEPISPVIGVFQDHVVDTVSWDTLLNLDDADFATILEELNMPTPYGQAFDGPSKTAMHPLTFRDVLQSNLLVPNVGFVDLSADLY